MVITMCKDCILFDKEKQYCVLFDEETNGKPKQYGCWVRQPMSAEKIVNWIKESIEEWYEAREEGEEIYAGYMLDNIYEQILYETSEDYYSKKIRDVLKIKQENE